MPTLTLIVHACKYEAELNPGLERKDLKYNITKMLT
jgi:hypothetical protein